MVDKVAQTEFMFEKAAQTDSLSGSRRYLSDLSANPRLHLAYLSVAELISPLGSSGRVP